MKHLLLAVVVSVGIFHCLSLPTLKALLTVRRRPAQPVQPLATARRRRS